MTQSINAQQDRRLSLLFVTLTALTALVGTLAFIESKKHAKLNDEILALDKEIKTIELALKKKEASNNL
jgi:hypothetical protein